MRVCAPAISRACARVVTLMSRELALVSLVYSANSEKPFFKLFYAMAYKFNETGSSSSGSGGGFDPATYAIYGGLQAVGEIGSAWIGAESAKETNKQNYKYTKKLMALQQKYARENWELQNVYNTPAAQRARMEAAGINPNVAFGDGVSATSGSAGAIDTPTPAMFEGHNPGIPIAQGLQQISQIPMQMLSYQQMAANINKTNSAAALDQAKTIGTLLQNDKMRSIASTWLPQALADLELTKNKGALTYAQTAVAQANLANVKETLNGLKLDNKQKEIFIRNFQDWLDSQMRVNNSQADVLDARFLRETFGLQIDAATLHKLQMEANKLYMEYSYLIPKLGTYYDSSWDLNEARVEEANQAVDKMKAEVETMAERLAIDWVRARVDSDSLEWSKERFEQEVKIKKAEIYSTLAKGIFDSATRLAVGKMIKGSKAMKDFGKGFGYDFTGNVSTSLK